MNYPYSDEFMYGADFGVDAMSAGIVGVFFAIYMIAMFFSFAFSIVSYILTSLGTYTIAERRGIRYPWLTWLPFGNLWILGSISDQYQYIVKGKIKNRRKVMLGLSIGVVAAYIIFLFATVTGIILSENAVYFGSEAAMLVLVVICTLVMLVTGIILIVYQYISLHDLYRSCHPNNAALYTVLSILISATMPFFVFFSRKKDLGMPPRKQAPAPAPVQPEVLPQPEAVAEEAAAEQEEAEEVEEGFAKPEEFEE